MAPELQFQQLAGILRRKSRLILAMALLGTTLAAFVGLLIAPKYTAKAQIVVEPQFVPGPIGAAPVNDETVIDTQVTTLTSRDHLQRVLDSLADDPEFRAGVVKAAPAAAVLANDDKAESRSPPTGEEAAGPPEGESLTEIKHRFNLWWPLTLKEIKRRLDLWTSMHAQGAALSFEELERYLTVNQERRSRVITIRFTSTTPEKAAAVANRIARLYVERQTEQKRAYMSNELARLTTGITKLKSEIERAGLAMKQWLASAHGEDEGRQAEMRLQQFEHEAAVNWQLYDKLLGRQREIRDQQETIAANSSILSLAWPPNRPSSANPLLFILPALIVSAICSGLLIVLLERLDRKLRSNRDIDDALGIPCLGLVPRSVGTTRPLQLLLREPFAAYTEAIRSVVAALQFGKSEGAPRVVLISSSVPGEGKTTLAISLAAYAALLGHRVLLVDLDFRHPAILRELGGKADRGILDLFLHDRSLAEITQRIPGLGLDYLPMLSCPVDPVALFAGEQMPRLVHELRQDYDCVIIDSPPLLGVTEARLLAAMADKVLFLVKWGSTRREVAQNALNLLRDPGDRQHSKILCGLVTQVNLKKHARYRYGDVGELFVRFRQYYSRYVRWPI
jgi:polysaccharide biosynthesis transport protein